jgi:hypothetical protein|nr:MAG TPA: hypothetical protein [Caudoviricetes sp.]
MFEIISIVSILMILSMAIGYGASPIIILLLALGLLGPLLCSLGNLTSREEEDNETRN